MATLEKKNIQIHKQPNITGLNEFGFFFKNQKTRFQNKLNAILNVQVTGMYNHPSLVVGKHTASYQCRKCRHEAGQNRQRTYLKGHPKTGRKIRE